MHMPGPFQCSLKIEGTFLLYKIGSGFILPGFDLSDKLLCGPLFFLEQLDFYEIQRLVAQTSIGAS